jgi:hypothetical protein
VGKLSYGLIVRYRIYTNYVELSVLLHVSRVFFRITVSFREKHMD